MTVEELKSMKGRMDQYKEKLIADLTEPFVIAGSIYDLDKEIEKMGYKLIAYAHNEGVPLISFEKKVLFNLPSENGITDIINHEIVMNVLRYDRVPKGINMEQCSPYWIESHYAAEPYTMKRSVSWGVMPFKNTLVAIKTAEAEVKELFYIMMHRDKRIYDKVQRSKGLHKL